MTALTLEAAYRALKRGEVAGVYYLTGEVDVLKEELAASIIEAAVDISARDFNLDIRSAGDLEGESLHALIETPPMLAERRAVVVKSLEQWRANASIWQVLGRYLERPSPTTVLILIHGAGEKPNPSVSSKASHVDVSALSPELVRRWVNARAGKAGVTLEPDAVEHLVTAVGSDLASLAMELDKLAAATTPGQPVTLAQVGEFVGVRRGETLVDWIDAVLGRNTESAVALLDVVLPQPGVNGVRMATALGTALLGTRYAKALADAGTNPREISNQIFGFLRSARPQGVGLWSDEAKRWSRAAASWSAAELEEGLGIAYEADRALKTSTLSDERGVLAAALLRLGRKSGTRRPGVAA